ncbi:MAG: hypothetical protein ACKOA9_08485 [Actinomycetota bacterium]
MTGRRAGRLAAALVVGAVVLAAPAGAGAVSRTPAQRVLVFTLPYVSWTDVDRATMPHLDRFLRHAGVAALSTRVDARTTSLGDGYATIGAGTRTVATDAAPAGGLMAGERFGAASAGDAYTQRTGRRVTGTIVQTSIVGVLGANAALHYDSEVGVLAGALAGAGIDRAVVANGDGEDPDAARSDLDATPGPARQRAAVLGLMDPRGQVAGGRVDVGLLTRDPRAPFGVRLDRARVLEAFRTAWTGRTVTLVEASDLVRVARYAPYGTPAAHDRQLARALRASDALFGALLDAADLRRDAVMVVGPAHVPGRVTLTPLAVRGPGVESGLLRSATTRRAGFVQIQDVAPTILAALGVEAPASMEGRPAEVRPAGTQVADRLAGLRRADAAAQFRDGRIGEVYGLLAGTVAVVLAIGLVACARPASARRGRLAMFTALWALGLLVAAFLVRLVPLHEAGVAIFYVALLGVGAAVAVIGTVAGRRSPIDGLLVGLLAIVVVLGLDATRGAPLVLNSVLGYSPTVAGRFAGFGNPAYAAFSAAALCAAILLAHRLGGRRGRMVAGSVFAVAVIVDVAPMWGSDVGGILSMVPAYGVAMVVLLGRRVRLRTALLAGVGVAAVLLAAAAVDVARPAAERTHLGRLVEQVRDNGLGELASVVTRKLDANLSTVGTNILGLVLLVAVVGFVVLWRRDRDRLAAVLRRVPEWRAACIGFAVLAVLGFAGNDSGMTVPGIMLVVFVAAWVHLLVTTEVPAPAPPARADAPPAPVGPRTGATG